MHDTYDQEIIWNWIPLVSIGPIKFGQDANLLIQRYSLKKCEWDDTEDQITYEFPDFTATVIVIDGKVDNVDCDDQFYYMGNIMIGMHLREALKILGPPDEVDKFYADIRPLTFDKYGLMLWINKNDIVDSAIFSGPLEEENGEEKIL